MTVRFDTVGSLSGGTAPDDVAKATMVLQTVGQRFRQRLCLRQRLVGV